MPVQAEIDGTSRDVPRGAERHVSCQVVVTRLRGERISAVPRQELNAAVAMAVHLLDVGIGVFTDRERRRVNGLTLVFAGTSSDGNRNVDRRCMLGVVLARDRSGGAIIVVPVEDCVLVIPVVTSRRNLFRLGLGLEGRVRECRRVGLLADCLAGRRRGDLARRCDGFFLILSAYLTIVSCLDGLGAVPCISGRPPGVLDISLDLATVVQSEQVRVVAGECTQVAVAAEAVRD